MYEFTHRLPHGPWSKPSRNEEEYFHRLEFRQRREEARRREAERARAEAERLREVHRDRCPRCGVKLEPFRFHHARADQCPVCGGVWVTREVFEELTRSERGPLTELFRDVLVDHSLGGLRDPPRERG